jgi:hypothetical protein
MWTRANLWQMTENQPCMLMNTKRMVVKYYLCQGCGLYCRLSLGNVQYQGKTAFPEFVPEFIPFQAGAIIDSTLPSVISLYKSTQDVRTISVLICNCSAAIVGNQARMLVCGISSHSSILLRQWTVSQRYLSHHQVWCDLQLEYDVERSCISSSFRHIPHWFRQHFAFL